MHPGVRKGILRLRPATLLWSFAPMSLRSPSLRMTAWIFLSFIQPSSRPIGASNLRPDESGLRLAQRLTGSAWLKVQRSKFKVFRWPNLLSSQLPNFLHYASRCYRGDPSTAFIRLRLPFGTTADSLRSGWQRWYFYRLSPGLWPACVVKH
jgi:hypothetical protein